MKGIYPEKLLCLIRGHAWIHERQHDAGFSYRFRKYRCGLCGQTRLTTAPSENDDA